MEPPDQGSVKLNFDGFVRNGSTAIGFTIRDDRGNPMISACKQIGDASVLVAEATTLRDGLHIVCLNHLKNVIVDGDSKLLVDSLTGKAEVPWRIKTLVSDILTLAQQCHSIVFRHIFREANFLLINLLVMATRILHLLYGSTVSHFCVPS
ncbi:hypothetical protein ACLB2K_011565 [Fragaria x ananassa]